MYLECFNTYLSNFACFIGVLLVFILNISTLSRVSFLLLFIIIFIYFISGFGAGDIYFILYVKYILHFNLNSSYLQFYHGC